MRIFKTSNLFYLSRRDLLVLAIDFFCCAISFWVAHTIIWPTPAFADDPVILAYAAIFGGLCAVGTLIAGINGSAWRYTSLPELVGLLKAIVGGAVAFTVIAFMVSRGFALPRSAPVLAAIFSVISMAGLRITYRMSRERLGLVKRQIRGETTPVKNVALIGVNNNADMYIRQTRRLTNVRLNIVGIFDERPRWHGNRLQGAQVVGSIKDLEYWQNRWQLQGRPAKQLVITDPGAKPEQIAEIVAEAAKVRIPVRRLQNISEDQHNELKRVKPRDVRIMDLIGRKEVQMDVELMGRFIFGKTVLITGAGGSIGSEIARQVAAHKPALMILIDNSEVALYHIEHEIMNAWPDVKVAGCLADVRDKVRMTGIFSDYQPEMVFHAAALKHVPLMEVNRVECMRTNISGTRVIADLADECDVEVFVMISTDKAVNPVSVMGASKRAAEAYVQAKDKSSVSTRYLTVRFGNVLDSNGSVLPLFRRQLQEGGPLTVTHPDIKRYFMTISEAVRLVFKASIFGAENPSLRGSVYVLDMGKPVRIYEIAERMIQLAGLVPGTDIDIDIIGLRPGEKLNEDLFGANEPKIETDQDGFVVAAPKIADISLMNKSLDEMEKHLEARNGDAAIKLLRHIVPDYQPNPPQADDQLVDQEQLSTRATN
ncbi:MAG: nucleoside-diphosphate sugar epimerase/dehydratase [Pseudomonadota bacterium]